MKIKKFNESKEVKTKVLYVSGDDYASLSFEKQFKGEKVSSIIEKIDKIKIEYEDEYDIYVLEFSNIDPKFVKFVREYIQDYDDSKHRNFYLENENIG